MLDFADLRTRERVADALACNDVLEAVERGGAASLYERLALPKRRARRGEIRAAFRVLDPRLASAQKEIGAALARAGQHSQQAHGFVRGRSAVTAARQHLAQKVLLHLDIRDFFDAIRLSHVKSAFDKVGAGGEASEALALLCTLNDRLVQGSSASPAISNAVMISPDRELAALSDLVGCAFTRYADDLVFSGEVVPDVSQVGGILSRFGFTLNDKKTRFQRRGGPQYVAGLAVGNPSAPRVPRRLKLNLRLIVHYATRYGLDNHLAKAFDLEGLACAEMARSPDISQAQATRIVASREAKRVEGQIAYVSGVEPELGARLRALWRECARQSSLLTSGD